MARSGWLLFGPLQWIRYVNKHVKVKAGRDEEHRGHVLTVDPVSASVVLVNFGEEGTVSVRVVMGHAVEEVEVLQQADMETTARLSAVLLLPDSSRFSVGELQRRKECVRRWLEKNRVPVENDYGSEALKVGGTLTVMPPYGPDDCQGSNEIILSRVQKLLLMNPATLDGPGDGSE
ncbi:gem-associated protein 6 [Thalassophryne amazonica]|uniref:gem-associated protein 6 n=1 Tax=Thalassophryne amazonica TaxID=390379 RepID=UPI00147103C5|nr:gem-associated protein 6 [Thalassophryne amazonica]